MNQRMSWSNLNVGARALRYGGFDQRKEGFDLRPAEGCWVSAEKGCRQSCFGYGEFLGHD